MCIVVSLAFWLWLVHVPDSHTVHFNNLAPIVEMQYAEHSILLIVYYCDVPNFANILLFACEEHDNKLTINMLIVHFCFSTFILIGSPFHRGARTTIKDGGGLTALERRMELGAITDEELFILFVRYDQ